MKQAISLLLALVLCLSLCACGKSEAVKNVEAMIDALGEITLESIDAIRSAEDAYDALTEEEQKKVGNYKTLTEARDAYYELALVGDWCHYYINLWDVESLYKHINFRLNSNMTFDSLSPDDDYCQKAGEKGSWEVSNGSLFLGPLEIKIINDGTRLHLEIDSLTYMRKKEYHDFLDEIFLIVDLAEVDVNEYCEPVLYNFQDVDTWGEPIDEVCTMLMLKNKLYDDGWLYLSQTEDFAIEVFTPEYNVSNEEKTIASIETTTSTPFGAVLKLYYWNAEDGEPICDLSMDKVSFGRTRGKMIFINSAFVNEVKQDEWRRLIINDFTESGDFISGEWYDGFDY